MSGFQSDPDLGELARRIRRLPTQLFLSLPSWPEEYGWLWARLDFDAPIGRRWRVWVDAAPGNAWGGETVAGSGIPARVGHDGTAVLNAGCRVDENYYVHRGRLRREWVEENALRWAAAIREALAEEIAQAHPGG